MMARRERPPPSYSILVPTYNERYNLPILTYLIDRELTLLAVSYEIIVIDDNSPDGTLEVARSLQEIYGRERIVLKPRPAHLDIANAYMHGLEHSTGTFVITLDADLTHHPKYLVDMIEKQKEGDYDLVTATRFAATGGSIGWSALRRLQSCAANVLGTGLLSPGPSDVTTSFRLYKRKRLLQLVSVCDGDRWNVFQLELLVRARQLGLTMAEVPTCFVRQAPSSSALGAQDSLAFVKDIVRLLFEIDY